MEDNRIPTHLWVTAHLRACSAQGIPAVVIHTGEKMGGSVMLKLYEPPDTCRLYSLMRDLDGKLAWYPAHKEDHIDEVEASDRIKKAVARDPDLWVVEVEPGGNQHPFEELP
jgi:hypothetical protein